MQGNFLTDIFDLVNCTLLKMLKCAEFTAAYWMLNPFGDIGANVSLQLTSQTQFAKCKNKTFSLEINVKHIKIDFFNIYI